MPTPRQCAECGASLPDDAPDGLCPTCGFRAALKADPPATAPFHPSALFDPTSEGQPFRADAAGASPSAGGEGERQEDPQSPDTHRSPPARVRYFGDYELLEEIARGGMGVVYRARQVSLNRIVAVKMILAGQLASAGDVQRFRAEAEAAANLNHPNIVAIHEVGEHDGQHYFSMDYLEGRNLAELVRDHPLPARQAAMYLKTIAEAIHYAHQRGTLHRDLKPSNVLIDANDQPRITDFGLAKRFGVPPSGGPGSEASKASQSSNTQPAEAGTPNSEGRIRPSDLTLSGQVLGSPNFMPPEQAAGRRGQFGPHSDVYSLGAILYHVLTARPPFLAETLSETLQQVQHSDPISPRLLNPGVPRDLETVCLKCLEKEPRQRYATAQALADELGRFLSGEPVRARPVGPVGKAWRWCRRKPALAGALAACALILISGVAGITWQWRRAEQNARRSEQVAQFLKDMLNGVEPSVALGRDTTMLREILDKTAERLGKDLKDQPAVEAELRMTIGEVYLELAEYVKAETMFREALALRKMLFGPEHPDVATSLSDLGVARSYDGQYVQAETLHREALAMRKKLLGSEHPDVATSLDNLASDLLRQGKYAEAETLLREALAMRKKLLGSEHPDVATSLNNLAFALEQQGKYAEAETLHREALAMQKKLLGSEHPDVAISLSNLASALAQQGKYAEAETLLREVLAMRKKLLGDEHPDVARSLNNLAGALAQQGKNTEAEPLYRESLAMRKKLLGNEHPDVATALGNLAGLLESQGKIAEAETMFREALVIDRKRLGNEHPRVAMWLGSLARVLDLERKYAEAEVMYREALAMQKRLLGNEHPDMATSLQNLAVALGHQSNHAEAEALYREALAMDKKLLGNEHPNVAYTLRNLAVELEQQGNYAESELLQREALAMRRKLLGDEHWAVRDSLNKLVDVLSKQGKYAEADQLFDELPLAAAEIQPQRIALLRLRGSFRGRRGRFAEAAADFTRVIEFKPDDYDAWHLLAAILVQNGQLDAYQEHCRKSLERFGKTTDPLIATRMAKDCLILPDSGVELRAADAWAETSLTAGTNHPAWPALISTKGVTEYRQGRFDSAVNWMEKALACPKEARGAWLDAETYAVLAMAHFQLKQIDEARSALAKGVQIAQTDLPKLESGDLGVGWVDWIIAHALMNEATALIEGGANRRQ